MTTDLIELSNKAAEVLGVPASVPVYAGDHPEIGPIYDNIWLAEDSGRCADIAADRRIGTVHYKDDCVITTWINEDEDYCKTIVLLADHNGDRKQAWRVAVLKAVIEQGKDNK